MNAPDATRQARGVALLLLGLLVVTAMDAMAKELTTRYDPLQVLWFRFALQSMVVVAVLAPSLRRRLTMRRFGMQAFCAALMLCGNLFFFISLSGAPLGQVAAVFQVAPLMITALAALVLHEPVGARRWIAVAIGLCGALIIIRPGAEVFSASSALPLAAAACYASFAIALRKLGDQDPLNTLLMTTLLVTLGASLLVPMVWRPVDAGDLTALIGLGALGALAQFCMISALSLTPASILAPFNYTQLVWAMLIGLAAFGEIPGVWTLTGAAVIVGAGIYVWRRERLAE